MNRVVHFEIHAKDLDKAEKFYTDVFGWKVTAMGETFGGYRIIVSDADKPKDAAPTDPKWWGINGGLTKRMGEPPVGNEPVNAFVCIVGVDDIDTSIAKVLAAGGTIALEKMNVPGVGLLVYVKDPENNLFGMIQAEMPSGATPATG
jgi:predicted enzyme related to lactoylglutathione lyase